MCLAPDDGDDDDIGIDDDGRIHGDDNDVGILVKILFVEKMMMMMMMIVVVMKMMKMMMMMMG